ncbi:MAG: hypothetical protein Q9187_004758 [Circinaria calcarea]
MPGLLCCVARHQPSPELQNLRHGGPLRDDRLVRSTLPNALDTAQSSKSDEEVQEIRKIFASSTTEIGNQEPSRSSAHDDWRGSNSRLSHAIRQRFSRDSGLSRRSSKKELRSMPRQDEIERRNESRQTLPKQVQEDILDDRTASQGGYDTDAEMIATPRAMSGRSGGAIKTSPQRLSNIIKQRESLNSMHNQQDRTDISVHRLHMSSGTVVHEKQDNDEPVFRDQDHWEDSNQQPSPAVRPDDGRHLPNSSEIGRDIISMPANASPKMGLQAFDIVVRRTRSTGSMMQKTARAGSFHVVEIPLAPDLLPLRLPSITESVQRDWILQAQPIPHESYSVAPLPSNTESINKDTLTNCSANHSAVRSTSWLRGASGSLKPSEHWGKEKGGTLDDQSHSTRNESRCDPITEELKFGGLDGDGTSDAVPQPTIDFGHTSSKAPNSFMSNGGQPDNDVHILQPRPSRSLLLGASMPQLEARAKHERGKSTGDESMKSLNQSVLEHRRYPSGQADSFFSQKYGFVPKDNASSVYTSRVGSLLSSPSNSFIRVPRPLGNFQGPLDSLESELMRRRTTDTSSIQSSSESNWDQEPGATESRILPRVKSSSLPRGSRFQEVYETQSKYDTRHGGNPLLAVRNNAKRAYSSYNGNEEWYSAGTRSGYGYGFLTGGNEDATNVWERTLKAHAKEASSILNGDAEKGAHKYSIKNRTHTRRVQSSPPLMITKTPSILMNMSGEINQIGRDEVVADTNRVAVKVQRLPNQSTRSLDSWSRFPSHSRASRSATPAGKADSVEARDFVTDSFRVEGGGDRKRRVSLLGRKKSRSMTFGKNLVKSWRRLYTSRSFDLRRFERGFRSSVSMGGELKLPELEVLPPLSPLPSLDEQRNSAQFTGSDGAFTSIASREGTVYSRDDEITGRSANIWSKLYEDCVSYPRDNEEASVREVPMSQLQGLSFPAPSGPRSLREISSNSGANMRDSTLDFQKSLQAHELKAREEALQAAEQAWTS